MFVNTMGSFKLDRNLSHLAITEESISHHYTKKLRKLFGRYLFSKIFSRYILNIDKISSDYYKIMYSEYLTIKNF